MKLLRIWNRVETESNKKMKQELLDTSKLIIIVGLSTCLINFVGNTVSQFALKIRAVVGPMVLGTYTPANHIVTKIIAFHTTNCSIVLLMNLAAASSLRYPLS